MKLAPDHIFLTSEDMGSTSASPNMILTVKQDPKPSLWTSKWDLMAYIFLENDSSTFSFSG